MGFLCCKWRHSPKLGAWCCQNLFPLGTVISPEWKMHKKQRLQLPKSSECHYLSMRGGGGGTSATLAQVGVIMSHTFKIPEWHVYVGFLGGVWVMKKTLVAVVGPWKSE